MACCTAGAGSQVPLARSSQAAHLPGDQSHPGAFAAAAASTGVCCCCTLRWPPLTLAAFSQELPPSFHHTLPNTTTLHNAPAAHTQRPPTRPAMLAGTTVQHLPFALKRAVSTLRTGLGDIDGYLPSETSIQSFRRILPSRSFLVSTHTKMSFGCELVMYHCVSMHFHNLTLLNININTNFLAGWSASFVPHVVSPHCH